jgi:hypothetical protein
MIRRLALRMLVVAAALAPMDGLRLTGIGSVADAAVLATIAASFAVLVTTGHVARPGPFRTLLLASVAFVTLGLLAAVEPAVWSDHLLSSARWTVATILLPISILVLRPSRMQVAGMARAYVLGAALSALLAIGQPGRGTGLSQHPNTLGATSMLGACLLLGVIASDGGTSTQRRTAEMLILGVLVFGVLESGSRASLSGTVIGGLAFLLAQPRPRLVMAGALLAASLSLGVGLWTPGAESALGRMMNIDGSAAQSDARREAYRSEVLERIEASWFRGTGFADSTRAHSLPLQAVGTTGIGGGLAFATIAVSVVRTLWGVRANPLSAGFFAAAVAYFAAGLASNAMWDRWIWVPLVLGLEHARLQAPAQVGPQEVPNSAGVPYPLL